MIYWAHPGSFMAIEATTLCIDRRTGQVGILSIGCTPVAQAIVMRLWSLIPRHPRVEYSSWRFRRRSRRLCRESKEAATTLA